MGAFRTSDQAEDGTATRPELAFGPGEAELDVALIDAAGHRDAAALRAEAMRCRRLAYAVSDQRTVDALLAMAREYDEVARRLG